MATPSDTHDHGAVKNATNPLAGTWRLVALEEPRPDGTLHPVDATGQFIFTTDGHASVQVMMRESTTHGSAGPVQYSQGGYEASFGRYTVDEQTRTFTFTIDGALVRSLVGKVLARRFELTDNRLVVRPTPSDERWRVTWERM